MLLVVAINTFLRKFIGSMITITVICKPVTEIPFIKAVLTLTNHTPSLDQKRLESGCVRSPSPRTKVPSSSSPELEFGIGNDYSLGDVVR